METALGARAGASSRWFYAWMAATCMAIAVIGFVPTYFVPLVQGRFVGPHLVHIHGLIFFAWTALFCVQTWLVASGGVLAHRNWGMLGIALASAMFFITMTTMIFRLQQAEAAGVGAAARDFAYVTFSGIIFFAVLFTLAIVHVKNGDVHKRLMLLATISLLDAPIARWFLVALAPPPDPSAPLQVPPVFVSVPPAVVSDLLVVAAIVFDWRMRGRPHPVYLIGGAALVLMQLSRVPIAATPAWDAVALWLQGLGAAPAL
jgi:hypothetical protein